MKYLIVIADGSADNEIESLGNKTPLEVANLANINWLAARGEIGSARTVPEGIAPGSDAANLAVLGYDPRVYLTGRSPLEVAAIGIDMNSNQLAFRANLITVDPAGNENYEDFFIRDHSAGDITTEEAAEIIKTIAEHFDTDTMKFYSGTGYRECLLVDGTNHMDYFCAPPHDLLDRRVGDHVPTGKDSSIIYDFMKKSYEILKDHPVNIKRIEKGLNPANSLWIWGQGVKPELPNIRERYGIDGPVISAVDLIKGIGHFSGLEFPNVEGATGNIHTNFENKVAKAIEAYEAGKNFVYMHLEGTDECSHMGDMEAKIRCCEYIDYRVVKPLHEYLKSTGDDFRILIIPDHRTPLCIRTHSSDPVPFVIYDSRRETEPDESKQFNERAALASKNHYEDGFKLADYFFEKKC